MMYLSLPTTLSNHFWNGCLGVKFVIRIIHLMSPSIDMSFWMYGYQLDQVFFGIRDPDHFIYYFPAFVRWIFQVWVGERVQVFPAGHGADQIWEAKTAGTGTRGHSVFFRVIWFCCRGAERRQQGRGKKVPSGSLGSCHISFFCEELWSNLCFECSLYMGWHTTQLYWDDFEPLWGSVLTN